MEFKFRNWQVYNDARKFRTETLKDIYSKIPREDKFNLGDQLKRALISIILNIAEGAYRKSDKDLYHFLNQADTSLNEVIACFDICLDDKIINKEIHEIYFGKAREIIRQLTAFRRSLQKQFKKV